MKRTRTRTSHKIVGFFFFLLMLGSGLLLGTQSTLILKRDASGAVNAVNAWRLSGKLTLISRSVANLRDAKMARVALSETDRRSAAHRDAFGMASAPEELILVGDGTLAYPYQDDLPLIRAFLDNPRNSETVLTHPVDIRRTVASWFLLALALASAAGWAITKWLGRDPLAHLPRKVKPLPPQIGAAVFIGGIVLVGAFFTVGNQVFGPLATRKVALLLASASSDDAAGIEKAIRAGVFVDARDDQGMTALILAARAGALRAADALLRARANPDLRDMSDDSALGLAIQGSHAALALRLIDGGANIRAVDSNGRSPLFMAARAGDAAILQRLLAAGGAAEQRDAQGWTPLMAAAASGDAASVRTLIAAGADPLASLADGRRAVNLAASEQARHEILRSTRAR